MNVLAIDIDAILDTSYGGRVIDSAYRAGYKVVWICTSKDKKQIARTRFFEFDHNFGSAPILTVQNCADGLSEFETHFSVGEVDRLLTPKDESLMLLFMIVLPCARYFHVTQESDFDFLLPPPPPSEEFLRQLL